MPHRLKICGSIYLTPCLRRVRKDLGIFQGKMELRLAAVGMLEVILMQPVTEQLVLVYILNDEQMFPNVQRNVFLRIAVCTAFCVIINNTRISALRRREKICLPSDSLNVCLWKLVMLLLRFGGVRNGKYL